MSDFNIKEGGEFSICIVQSISGGYFGVRNSNDEQYFGRDTVRVSEPVLVQFKPRKPEDVMQAAVEAIDLEMTRLQADVELKLSDLRQRKQSLLALTHDSVDNG